MDSRGVSDVVGFVLAFSLVASTTGVVYAVGFVGLEAARDAERIDNAERAFEVLGENVADLYRGGAPSRKTEIKLADARLSLAETTTMNVSVEGDTDGEGNPIHYEANLRPIVFSADGTEIVYEGGAIVRSTDGHARMVRDPPFRFDDRRVVLSYVVTGDAGGSSISGDATALVRSVRSGRSLLAHDDADPRITVRIETTAPRAAAWEAYINERASWSDVNWNAPGSPPCDSSELGDGRGEVVCHVRSDSLYLTSTGIAVEITA